MPVYKVTAVFSKLGHHPRTGMISHEYAIPAENYRDALSQVANYFEGTPQFLCTTGAQQIPDDVPTDLLPTLCPTCSRFHDTLRLETPYGGGVLAWCCCGTVYLVDSTSTQVIGSTYPPDARAIAREVLERPVNGPGDSDDPLFEDM